MLLSLPSCKKKETQVNEESSMKVGFLYAYDYWNLYDYTDSRYPAKEDYEKAVTSYLSNIANFLGKENWLSQYDSTYKTLYIKLVVHSSTPGGAISWPTQYTSDSLVCELRINPDYFTGDKPHNPICHELTHLITYNPKLQLPSLSLSLNDGLCEYVSHSIGEINDCFTFDIDSHTYALSFDELIKNSQEEQIILDDVINNIGIQEYPSYHYTSFSKEWKYSYTYNYSFVSYLADTYGIDYFLSLQDPCEDVKQMEEHQAKLQELKKEWLDFLDQYTCTMTYPEMMDYLNQRRNQSL